MLSTADIMVNKTNLAPILKEFIRKQGRQQYTAVIADVWKGL